MSGAIRGWPGNSPGPRVESGGEPVVACLRDYQKFLETELLPRANGEWRIGKEKFSRKLELELDAGLTADQGWRTRKSEFARRRARHVRDSRASFWSRYYPMLALPPDDTEGRRYTVQQALRAVAQEHGKPEDLNARREADGGPD